MVVKYAKAQYMAKINELEGWKTQLEGSLGNLEGYRQQMFSFWADDNAKAVSDALTKEINAVKNAMATVSEYLIFYRSCVDKLEGADMNVLSTIESAIGILSGLGL